MLQTPGYFGIQAGQPAQRAPAEVATLQGIRRVGKGGGQFGEVFAGPRPLERLLAAQAQLLQLFRTRRFGCAQQDVGQLVFLIAAGSCLIGEVIVDFAVGDDQLAIDLPFAQANRDHFVTDIFPEAGVLDAILFQRCTEFRNGHPVSCRDAADGLIELDIVDPHAGILGVLQLRTIHDQALEHLALQNILRRQGSSLFFQLLERCRKTIA
ncbi:hypothetical protein SDC9_144807 [bioreactor metagenome]|uniref:Uncharacterized protein n=1 Tax=bioreactor metagenome TaxID=1076179 RepID=A0A645EAI5_9ZZZZ